MPTRPRESSRRNQRQYPREGIRQGPRHDQGHGTERRSRHRSQDRLFSRLKRYGQLGRIFSAMLTAGIAMVGAYSVGHILSWEEFLVFMWLGFWFHSFGGAYNEICDYKLDSMVVELKDKPIVSGAVSMSQAIAFTLVTVFAGLIVLAFYFPYTWAIVFWSLSYIWAGHYDAKGKYTAYFFELSLGFTFFFWALFGAAAARPDFFGSLTMNTIAVALVIFCFAVYINWGNAMKDAPTDRKLRVPTRAVVWGYRHKQRLRMSSPHILYAFFIKFWVLLAFSLPILFSRLLSSPLPILSGPPVLLGLDLYSLFFFAFVVPTQLAIVVRARGRHDRAWWTNYIVMDMFLTWLAFAFMAVMVVGVWWSAFLFLLPLLWFAGTTTAIYGRPMRVGL